MTEVLKVNVSQIGAQLTFDRSPHSKIFVL